MDACFSSTLLANIAKHRRDSRLGAGEPFARALRIANFPVTIFQSFTSFG